MTAPPSTPLRTPWRGGVLAAVFGLTPLLAYTLYPKGSAGSGWANVYTFPTAGPTTADAGFATGLRLIAHLAAFPALRTTRSPA